MNIFWLLRMRRWTQRPPSRRAVLGVLAVVAACLLLFALERLMGGWPAALTPAGRPGGGAGLLRP